MSAVKQQSEAATALLPAKRSFAVAVAILLGFSSSGCPSSALIPWPGYSSLQTPSSIVRPWIVLKCTLSDDPSTRSLPGDLNPAITDLDTYIDLFLTIEGAGTGNMIDYYSDVSYGTISLSGSKVYGWYPAPFNGTEPGLAGSGNRYKRVQLCADAIPASEAAAIGFGAGWWGIIMVTNHRQDGGSCYYGQGSLTIQGKTYNLACVVFDPYSMWTAFAAQEVGHGLGMSHSWDNSPCEYCDQFDVMSTLNAWQFFSANYPPEYAETNHQNGLGSGGSGPGLNLPNLLFLNAVSQSQLATYKIGSAPQQFVVGALSHPFSAGFLGVKIVGSTPDDIFTVEYRQADGWDQGFPSNAVLIHEYKIGASPYSYLQEGPSIPCGGCSGSWPVNSTWSSAHASVYVSSIDPLFGTATVTISSH
ncbi:MAG TPA: hypothetical protein VE959_02645 [Bryobacteraceae bacterium]|nr:hypothetical protein [Bryobacteraceae bacterium]